MASKRVWKKASKSAKRGSVCQDQTREPQQRATCLQEVASGSKVQKAECPSCGKQFRLSNEETSQALKREGSKTEEVDAQADIEQFAQSMLQNIDDNYVRLGDKTFEMCIGNYYSTQVRGMFIAKKHLWLIREKSSRVWRYDSEQNVKLTQVPNVTSPLGMVLLSEASTIAIVLDTFDEKGRLHYVSITAELDILHSQYRDIPVSKPHTISLSRSTGELMIGTLNTEFLICNVKGDVQRRVTVDTSETLYPSCVARLERGFAVLMSMDGTGGTIHIVDESGKRTAESLDETKAIGVTHLINDSTGHVIASRRHNGLLVLNKRGHQSHVISQTSEGLLCLQGSTLCVTDGTSTVKGFEYLS